MKKKRCQIIDAIGGSSSFRSRGEARLAASLLLDRNRSLFRAYGPSPEDGGTRSIEAASVWAERVLSEIIPNNRLLVAIVEINRDLATPEDREAAELLRQHTDDLERKHQSTGPVTGPAARFPLSVDKLFM